MTDFKKLFKRATTFPAETQYKGQRIFVSDKFPVENRDTLVLSIESTNSKYIQGICIGITNGTFKICGKKHRKRKNMNIFFWEDTEILNPKKIKIQIFTNEGFIFIKNIWEAESCPPYVFNKGDKHACFIGTAEWHGTNRWNGAAMRMEETEGGRKYFCNDGEPDDDFDDIIFTVKNLGNIRDKQDV